ncbi:hypothetical protein MN608_09882 [Microdochium nivale]|nr:hypothetical protein MN608_09882 [Microdochium nivale]
MNGGRAGKRGENYVFKFSADEGEEEGKNDDTTDHGHESFTYQQQVNGGDSRLRRQSHKEDHTGRQGGGQFGSRQDYADQHAWRWRMGPA